MPLFGLDEVHAVALPKRRVALFVLEHLCVGPRPGSVVAPHTLTDDQQSHRVDEHGKGDDGLEAGRADTRGLMQITARLAKAELLPLLLGGHRLPALEDLVGVVAEVAQELKVHPAMGQLLGGDVAQVLRRLGVGN